MLCAAGDVLSDRSGSPKVEKSLLDRGTEKSARIRKIAPTNLWPAPAARVQEKQRPRTRVVVIVSRPRFSGQTAAPILETKWRFAPNRKNSVTRVTAAQAK